MTLVVEMIVDAVLAALPHRVFWYGVATLAALIALLIFMRP